MYLGTDVREFLPGGDLVQLKPDPRSGASASDVASARNARCLGALTDKRWGLVVHPGVERGGIHRNILVKKKRGKKRMF